jgi:hypothetical protein
LYIMFRLRYFTIVHNINEYKMMGQGASLGQLYDVQKKKYISKRHWLGLHIYYNTVNIMSNQTVNFFMQQTAKFPMGACTIIFLLS